METVAHRLAKQIIAESASITVPHRHLGDYVVERGWGQSYKTVHIEPWLASLCRRPDVMLTLPSAGRLHGEALYIEIHVHHAVDADKQRDFERGGLTAMEIRVSPELSSLSPELAAEEVLVRGRRRWISDPGGDAVREAVRRKRERQEAAANLAAEEALRREEKADAARVRRRESWQKRALADLTACEALAGRNWEGWARPDEYGRYLEDEGLKELFGHRVSGDMALEMPPHVWQARVLFEKFLRPVDGGAVSDIAAPDAKAVSQWLRRETRLYQGAEQLFSWWYGDPEQPQVFKRHEALREYFGATDRSRLVGTPWYVCQEIAQLWLSKRHLLESWASRNLGRGRYA